MASIITKETSTGTLVTNDVIHWRIPNWLQVQLSRESLEAIQFEFKAGINVPFQSKWLIGLKANESKSVGVSFNLIETIPTDLQISLRADVQLRRGNGGLHYNSPVEKILTTNQHAITSPIIEYMCEETAFKSFLNSSKELMFCIKLETRFQASTLSENIEPMGHKSFTSKLQKNYCDLLNQNLFSDVKVISKDGKEFSVHKAVLGARCMVFESMFSPKSKFSEGESGTIEVDDVGGKTMEILLRYFYAGELLPTWRDADTIFEFTYAAGKYQLTEVLETLDEMIGMPEDTDETCNVKLLSLLNKLRLKKAEARVVKRITKQTATAESAEDLFKILGKGFVSATQKQLPE